MLLTKTFVVNYIQNENCSAQLPGIESPAPGKKGKKPLRKHYYNSQEEEIIKEVVSLGAAGYQQTKMNRKIDMMKQETEREERKGKQEDTKLANEAELNKKEDDRAARGNKAK